MIWSVGIICFLLGSIAYSCFYQVKLLIDIKYELKNMKGR